MIEGEWPVSRTQATIQGMPPILVFSDDWGRHPSSCQHLIRHLLDHRVVLWVNTIGMKPPRFDGYTVRRGLEKLREWTLGVRHPVSRPSGGPAPTVISPKMWPSFRRSWTRALNRRLMLRSLRAAMASLPGPPIVVTTLPIVSDLVGAIPALRWVYYCVDDFSVWPGLDGDTIRAFELELLQKVDVVIAVSPTLQTRLASLGKHSELLTHGVDLEHWQGAMKRDDSPSPFVDGGQMPKPWVVFWGVIDRRMNVDYICRLSEQLKAGTILLVGPQDDPDPRLKQLALVRLLPALPYEQLPWLASQAGVLIMPYADLPVTRAMQPLKLKEYLATGKPVVVSDLPSTRLWDDCLDVATKAEDFAQVVCERLISGLPADQQEARTARLAEESWAAKARAFEIMIGGGEPLADHPPEAEA